MNAKSPSEQSQTELFSPRAGDCRLPLSAPITAPSAPRCSSNAQAERGFSLAASLLPCCFIHGAQGSFAKSSVVDLGRQTAPQIHQNSVRLNDILLCRLANRKENSGRSALKPRVFRADIVLSIAEGSFEVFVVFQRAPGGNPSLFNTHTHLLSHTSTHPES